MARVRPCVVVFGSSSAVEGEGTFVLAHALGKRLAESGADVATGGYGGVMAACSAGAREAGGHVIGVTVALYDALGTGNPWIAEHVHTRDLFERLRELMGRADAFIALPGSIGTLTEVFFAWTLIASEARPQAPLVLLGEPWHRVVAALRHPDLVPESLWAYVQVADTVDEAVHSAMLCISKGS